jgi:hypothetical protein
MKNCRLPLPAQAQYMGEMNFGDAMKQFVQKSKLKTGVQAHQLTDVWENIMGKTVSRYTDRLQLVNHTLFIHTQVAPLRHELNYQKEKIIQRVNEVLGEGTITNVVIK